MQVHLEGGDINLAVERVVGLRVDKVIATDTEVEASDERMILRTWRVIQARVVLAELTATCEPDRSVVVRLDLAIFELRLQRIVGIFELETNGEVVAGRIQFGCLHQKSVGHQVLRAKERRRGQLEVDPAGVPNDAAREPRRAA